MSTNGAIGTVFPDGTLKLAYNHYDSYPENYGLGYLALGGVKEGVALHELHDQKQFYDATGSGFLEWIYIDNQVSNTFEVFSTVAPTYGWGDRRLVISYSKDSLPSFEDFIEDISSHGED